MARRSLKLMAVSALGALLVAGCAPPGIDGDLVNNWAAMPQPESWSPKAGECHHGSVIYGDENLLAKYKPVGCDQPHQWETFYVGTLPGDRVNVPPVGSVDRAAVYEQCSAEADRFLGGPWRDARLTLHVLYPSEEAWSGGGRWFRCDLTTLSETLLRRESLRGALAEPGPLARRCYAKSGTNSVAPVACDEPHEYEYVGTWFAPQSMTHTEAWRRSDQIHRECRSLVAEFAKVPDDRTLRARTGTQIDVPHERDWDEGNRGVGCMLWLDRKLTRSMKGAGAKGLPINWS